jgi:hypothetical protein
MLPSRAYPVAYHRFLNSSESKAGAVDLCWLQRTEWLSPWEGQYASARTV